MSDQAAIDAVLAVLADEFHGIPPAFAVGDVPGTDGRSSETLPRRWIEVGLTRSYGGAYRAVGRSSSSYHYLTLGCADENTPSVRVWQGRMRGRLEAARIEAEGAVSSPLRFYAQDEVEYRRELGRHWQISTYSLAL